MKTILNLVLFVVLSIGISQISVAQGPGMNGAASPASIQLEARTDISTLFALDPLTQSLCFRDGGPGGVFQEGQTRNRCSDLNFNSYAANSFSVGVEGGRRGVIIDLGTAQNLKAKYGYSETVGDSQGFASLDVQNGKVMILKDYKAGTLQEIEQSAADLFSVPARSSASIPVKLGHIYLMRITDAHDKSYEMLAKMLVIAHVPNESVTVRWSLLANRLTAKL